MTEEYANQIHRCFNCGFCKFTSDYIDFNCPAYERFRFDSYSTGGRLSLIYAWLKGEIEWSEHLLEILYSCVTCKNCVENCVMRFSDDIVDWIIAARSDVMEKEKGKIPPAVRNFLEDIYKHGNPLKQARNKRGSWANGINKYQADDEYLFYVGCLGSYEELGQAMAGNIADLLNKAGVSFGILGAEEECCGNEAYNLGEKGLFEALAEKNINKFKEYGVKKIVTLCPHGYNIMKNNYSMLGTDLEVYHYTQILYDMIKKDKLKPLETKAKVTYHDPCFLARWNKVYDTPRKILQSIPGIELVEMRRNRKDAFCCGGGSGNFVIDLLEGGKEAPNRVRVREAYETGASVLAVACPSCMTMLTAAVKSEGLEEKLSVKDVSEIMNQGGRSN